MVLANAGLGQFARRSTSTWLPTLSPTSSCGGWRAMARCRTPANGRLALLREVRGMVEGRPDVRRSLTGCCKVQPPVRPARRRSSPRPVPGANPRGTDPLRLDEEVRTIDARIREAEFRDRFDLRQHWAVRISELSGLLLRHRPGIVHFSGPRQRRK